jgi:UDP-glucose 4-epimerase
MAILVTGGTGYIGSHTVVELLNSGFEIVIVDNLANSSTAVLTRIEAITAKSVTFINADVANIQAMREVFSTHDIDSVIHFAGFKAVGESSELPLAYYQNNIGGTLALLQVMNEFNCKKLVFSSSATVYGEHNPSPFNETMPTAATNPYGRTKLMTEQILSDLANSDKQWKIALLRYFNPIGAHESGTIGEDPNGIPNNLLPFVAQVAVGRLPQLSVFGDDYDTPDGTGVRDYIHVVDLAIGHSKAVLALADFDGCVPINLGSGEGTSVKQIIDLFAKISGQPIPYQVKPRRAGDIASFYADAGLAKELLDWQVDRDVEQMIADTWRWQSNNPQGYQVD